MRVDWAIACRYSEVNNNLATIVGAGIDHTWVPAVPASIQVVMAVRLVALLDELGEDQPHPFVCAVHAPDETKITEVGSELRLPKPPDARSDWLSGVHVPMAVQFEAPEEGTYTLEIRVDEHTSAVPMHVVTGLPPGMAPPPQDDA